MAATSSQEEQSHIKLTQLRTSYKQTMFQGRTKIRPFHKTHSCHLYCQYEFPIVLC